MTTRDPEKEDDLVDERKMPLVFDWQLDELNLSPDAIRVYLHLVHRVGTKDCAWPSYQTIGDHCFSTGSKRSPATRRRVAINAVAELIAAKVIRVKKSVRPGGKLNQSNRYFLTNAEVWQRLGTGGWCAPRTSKRTSKVVRPTHQVVRPAHQGSAPHAPKDPNNEDPNNEDPTFTARADAKRQKGIEASEPEIKSATDILLALFEWPFKDRGSLAVDAEDLVKEFGLEGLRAAQRAFRQRRWTGTRRYEFEWLRSFIRGLSEPKAAEAAAPILRNMHSSKRSAPLPCTLPLAETLPEGNNVIRMLTLPRPKDPPEVPTNPPCLEDLEMQSLIDTHVDMHFTPRQKASYERARAAMSQEQYKTYIETFIGQIRKTL